MHVRDYGWVALGGMLGATARYGLGLALDQYPVAWGLLLANVAGAVLLTLISIGHHRLSPAQRALLGTGFCGSFTTVSSLSADVAGQILEGDYLAGLGSLGLSLLLAWPLAWWLLRWHPPEEST